MMAQFGRRRLLRVILSFSLGLCAAGLPIAAADNAAAQGAVRSVHSDWQVRCDTPPGAQGLEPLWSDEKALPTPAEIDAPGLWLARIDLPSE